MTSETLGPYICTRCGAERDGSEVYVCETEAAQELKLRECPVPWCKGDAELQSYNAITQYQVAEYTMAGQLSVQTAT